MDIRKENEKSGLIYLMLLIICSILLVGSLLLNSINLLIPNFINLQVSSQRLYTDAMVHAQRNGTMLNAALLGFIALGILLLARVKPNGLTIGAVLLIIGFGFAGMTCISVAPIVLGTWIYAKLKKQRFKNYANESLLAFGLSPIINEIAFGQARAFDLASQIIMAVVFGIVIGFTTAPFASEIGKNNRPYAMQYKILGIGAVAFVFFSAYKSIIVDRTNIVNFFDTNSYLSGGSKYYYWILLSLVFVSFIIIGFLIEDKSFKPYINMLKEKTVHCDYIYKSEFSSILINIGIVGIVSLLYFLIVGVDFNGIVVCSLFISLSMAGLNLNPMHIPAVLLGLLISARTCLVALNAPQMLFAYAFSLGLVSIVRDKGLVYAIIAGLIFNYMNIYADKIVAGLNLYNSGAIMAISLIIVNTLHSAIKSQKISTHS